MEQKIGMVVAIEMDCVRARYGAGARVENAAGYELLAYTLPGARLYVLHCGIGELAAAAGTQFLISCCGVDVVVNFGVVGGLTEEMSRQKVCLVERVVHYDFDASAYAPVAPGQYPDMPDVYLPATAALVARAAELHPEARRVVCASGDKFVATEQAKRALHERFGADICEMEAAGVVRTCLRCGVPCLLVKAVSDGLAGGAEEFSRELDAAAALCLQMVDELLPALGGKAQGVDI